MQLAITDMRQDLSVPCIAIDGPAKAGKGTVRAMVAEHLGFHQLDSGMLYRAVGLIVFRRLLDHKKEKWGQAAEEVASNITLEDKRVFLGNDDVTSHLRDPNIGHYGSLVAVDPGVRSTLNVFYLTMRKAPGLVADGRDMCYIFDTPFRYFLTASPKVRAERQVIQAAVSACTPGYDSEVGKALVGIAERDKRDSGRETSPLRQHPASYPICTDFLSAALVADLIVQDFRNKL